jgi:hypothetical protein
MTCAALTIAASLPKYASATGAVRISAPLPALTLRKGRKPLGRADGDVPGIDCRAEHPGLTPV